MKTALIIPAYKPDVKMLALLERFAGNDEYMPVVVDDGSGREFAGIFSAIPSGVTLLRHAENRGKGAALKTAIAHILQEMPQCDIAVTADADGQHPYEDILRVCARARSADNTLVLGSRKFEGNVPLRSRFGNALTRQIFAAACGTKVYDTQTGLRAFDRKAMENFLHISGDRYEYEINMLLWASRNGMRIEEVPIKTVYIDDNASSHFHPIRDGIKIYACLLKFTASSLIAFCVDYVMVLLLQMLQGAETDTTLLISAVVARIVSGSVNFIINRTMVFQGNDSVKNSALKYAVLAVGILIVNYLLLNVSTLVLGIPLWLAKLLVEILLFAVSYVVQGRFVYSKKKK